MRIVACGLIAGAVLLVSVPVAMADVSVSPTSSDSQPTPQAEVSLLAVSLTLGGAVAMAGSGLVLVLTRRRALSRSRQRCSQAISPRVAFLDPKVASPAGPILNVLDKPTGHMGPPFDEPCTDVSMEPPARGGGVES